MRSFFSLFRGTTTGAGQAFRWFIARVRAHVSGRRGSNLLERTTRQDC